MELESFVIGIFLGGFFLHTLYITYFHLFILGRIEHMVIESRKWADNHIKSPPPSISPMLDIFSGYKPRFENVKS